MMKMIECDLLIAGAGTGGCAAAITALEAGLRVTMTSDVKWIGGQLTSQMVPPDEHWAIERFGGTKRYRQFRDGVRQYYRAHYPLRASSRALPHLNPGGGSVSRLCFEPKVGVEVLEAMLRPYRMNGQLRLLIGCKPTAVEMDGDLIREVHFQNIDSADTFTVKAPYVLDATELGDLLPLAGAEYVTGAESASETGEPHAPDQADPNDVQGFTWCAPLALDPDCPIGCDRYAIPRPEHYQRWRDFVPPVHPGWTGPLFSWKYPSPLTLEPIERDLLGNRGLWTYRRLVSQAHYEAPVHEVTLLNWPQNDYFCGNLIDQPPDTQARFLQEAKELTLSFIYWLQHEAPRPDGGCGYSGLHLRPDLCGTQDGLAQAPYIREARRIRGLVTVSENEIGCEARPGAIGAEPFVDSIGIGFYRIDLHPSVSGRNYVDVASYPFQIPMGSLIPRRIENLIAAGKCLSVTHIANGAYRLHPVEWNIGEAAAALAAFAIEKGKAPIQIHTDGNLRAELQSRLQNQGVELEWPKIH